MKWKSEQRALTKDLKENIVYLCINMENLKKKVNLYERVEIMH